MSTFVSSAAQYGRDHGLEKASWPTLRGVCSYYYTIFGSFSTEAKVQRIFDRLQKGEGHPDLFLWMGTKSLCLLEKKITPSFPNLSVIKHAWCRAYNPEKKEILERIGSTIYKPRPFLERKRPIKTGFEVASALLEKGERLDVDHFARLLLELTDRERKRLYCLAREKGLLEKVEREFRLENIRRAILLFVDPLYRTQQLQRAESESEREKISEISRYALTGIVAYAKGLHDVVETFRRIVHQKSWIENTSFNSFFLTWVSLCKSLPEFQGLKESLEAFAGKIGCRDAFEGVLSASVPQIRENEGRSRVVPQNFLTIIYRNKFGKDSIGEVAHDLFSISASIFLRSSPCELSLGRDPEEISTVFNNLFSLITHTILYLPSKGLKDTQRISKFWLRVALQLRDMGDGATSAIIIGALNCVHNRRLAYDQEQCLIKNYHEEFEKLSALFGPEDSYKKYREYARGVIVPYIAVAKGDFVSMAVAPANFNSGGLPDLIALAGKEVEALRAYQEKIRNTFFSKKETNIEELLSQSHLKGKGERDWDEQSLRLRPKGPTR